MSHYYTNDPNLDNTEKEISYTYKGNLLKFTVSSGVFSLSRIDYGTNILLQSLNEFHDKEILDIGCGYGAIGLCIAKSYPNSFVTLSDINTKALELTKKNAFRNNISNVNVIESNLYQNIDVKFDFIISNPPIRAGKKIVFEIIEKGYEYLKENGEFFVVIQKKQGAPSLEKHIVNIFKNIEIVRKEKGYFVFKCIKQN